MKPSDLIDELQKIVSEMPDADDGVVMLRVQGSLWILKSVEAKRSITRDHIPKITVVISAVEE